MLCHMQISEVLTQLQTSNNVYTTQANAFARFPRKFDPPSDNAVTAAESKLTGSKNV